MCEGMPERKFFVTLMDDTLPDPLVHRVQVNSPCACDLLAFVLEQPDLPFEPRFAFVAEELFSSSRLSY